MDIIEQIKERIPSIGAGMAVMGLASSILSIFDYNLRLLIWIDLWGNTTGWIIRVLLVVVGGALILLFNNKEEENEEEEINTENN